MTCLYENLHKNRDSLRRILITVRGGHIEETETASRTLVKRTINRLFKAAP